MKRILLSISIPLIVFLFFILSFSLAFSTGGWTGFLSGNLQCDVSFVESTERQCGYVEFLSDTLYLAYGFFIGGWWIILFGTIIIFYGSLLYGIFGLIKRFWWVAVIVAIVILLYFIQAYK